MDGPGAALMADTLGLSVGDLVDTRTVAGSSRAGGASARTSVGDGSFALLEVFVGEISSAATSAATDGCAERFAALRAFFMAFFSP